MEVLTRVLEIRIQGPGRSQKSMIVGLETGRMGLQIHSKRRGPSPTFLSEFGSPSAPFRPNTKNDFWLRPGPWLQIFRTMVRTSVALQVLQRELRGRRGRRWRRSGDRERWRLDLLDRRLRSRCAKIWAPLAV